MRKPCDALVVDTTDHVLLPVLIFVLMVLGQVLLGTIGALILYLVHPG